MKKYPRIHKAIDYGINLSNFRFSPEIRKDLVQCCLIRIYRKAFTRPPGLRMLSHIVNHVKFEIIDFLRRESKYNRRFKKGYEVVELKEYHRIALPTGISGFSWDMERLLDRRDRLICHMVIDGYKLVEIAGVIDRCPTLLNTQRGAFSRIAKKLELRQGGAS